MCADIHSTVNTHEGKLIRNQRFSCIAALVRLSLLGLSDESVLSSSRGTGKVPTLNPIRNRLTPLSLMTASNLTSWEDSSARGGGKEEENHQRKMPLLTLLKCVCAFVTIRRVS